jgi:SagB-type dehydrogenase family enzyme
MLNMETEALWRYHNETKHSYSSIRQSGHRLNWTTYPPPFKVYSEIQTIPLPRERQGSGADAMAAIAGARGAEQRAALDVRALSATLFYSAGVTRQRKYPGGEIYFRAAACTGALYEVELYVACGPLPELEAGLYHFDPAGFALEKLRTGDWRGALVHATANEVAVEQAQAVIVCTGTYWRNAWKYQARTYRHFFWDNGTILANLLATAAALHLPARLVMGFVDDEVNRLLDLDTQREVAISMVVLGKGSSSAADLPAAMIHPLNQKTGPPALGEVDYPLMREAHAASSLTTAEEIRRWRGGPPPVVEPEPSGTLVDLAPLKGADAPQDTIEQVIQRRGSTRRFARVPIRFEQLSTMLVAAAQRIAADFLGSDAGSGPESEISRLNDLYVIANAVEGLPSGSYYLRRDRPALELLRQGEFRDRAGYLGLEQELPADAAAAVFFLADLKVILELYGNRGYRAAQIEAGIIGGKLYLAAYALKIGATGLTFYDDDVTEFFSPHAAGKSAIFLLAMGIPARRALRTL